MQTFKTKAFARFVDRERLEDAELCQSIRRARTGLIDGGVIKQRIVCGFGGRFGGFRTIMLFRRGAGALRLRVPSCAAQTARDLATDMQAIEPLVAQPRPMAISQPCRANPRPPR